MWFYLTNAAPSSSRKIVTDFRCIYFVVRPHDLLCPYYEPLLWFMIQIFAGYIEELIAETTERCEFGEKQYSSNPPKTPNALASAYERPD